MKGAPARLRSQALGEAFDLLAAYPGHGGFFFERRGRGVAAGLDAGGFGASVAPADEIGLAQLARSTIARLRELVADTIPVAVGSVPFGPASRPQLTVPGILVRHDDRGSPTLLALEGSELPGRERIPNVPADAFTDLQLATSPTPERYLEAVASAVDRIRAGELDKVVLARTVAVDAGRPLDPRALAARLRAVDPDSYIFAVPTGLGSSLVGASPELLVRRSGGTVESRPMAGSAPRSGDPDEDRANAQALLDSGKDREEHRLVVDAIAETLGGMCEELVWDPEPMLHETANVWHLATGFRGRLRDQAPSAMEIVAELHPTPAVGGTPRAAALELIGELEPFDRGTYAGAVGWMDASGDGEWALALRCAELRGERATLFAGAGIVADSVPERELDETDRKFRAFLDALRWG